MGAAAAPAGIKTHVASHCALRGDPKGRSEEGASCVTCAVLCALSSISLLWGHAMPLEVDVATELDNMGAQALMLAVKTRLRPCGITRQSLRGVRTLSLTHRRVKCEHGHRVYRFIRSFVVRLLQRFSGMAAKCSSAHKDAVNGLVAGTARALQHLANARDQAVRPDALARSSPFHTGQSVD
jgi:hypothetical protein